jgi:hypothetical protein
MSFENGGLPAAQGAGSVAGLHLLNDPCMAEELRQVLPATDRRQRPIKIKEHRSTHGRTPRR